MANYTTEVKTIIRHFAASPSSTIAQQIDKAIPQIFNFDFPIWDADYKSTLCRKILLHYFNKEIGYETFALWQLALSERLNLIMPYYVDLWNTTQLQYNPLTDVDLWETLKRDATDVNNYSDSTNTTNKNTSNSTTSDTGTQQVDATDKVLNSDLPQANYANLDYGTDLNESESNTKTTTTAKTTGTDTTTGTGTATKQSTDNRKSNQNDVMHRAGLSGSRSYTDLILQYREAILNIDRMIIEELADLFMMIY